MAVLEFIGSHLLEILLSLATAGALAFCKYLNNERKKYKTLVEQEEGIKLDERIDEKLEPIIAEIEELRTYIRKTKDTEKYHIDLILSSYRFRLMQLCRLYIRQGFITQDQYDQLQEFYRVYTGLGGNGQAKDYFDKAVNLPLKG